MFTDALISKLRNFNHIFVKNIVQNNLISAGASRCSALRGACQSAPVMTLSASFLNGDGPDLQDRRESVQAGGDCLCAPGRGSHAKTAMTHSPGGTVRTGFTISTVAREHVNCNWVEGRPAQPRIRIYGRRRRPKINFERQTGPAAILRVLIFVSGVLAPAASGANF